MQENNTNLDMDQNGVISEKEISSFLRKTKIQSRIAISAFVAQIASFGWVLYADPERVMRIAGLIETQWFLQITIIGAYMGFTALMARK